MKAYTRFDILTWTPSEHFINERLDRYMGIIESKGFGSYFVVVLDRADGCYECLTNTGVLVVLTKDTYAGKRILVTAYCPKQDKVFAMFNSCGIERIPHWMTEKIADWEWLRQREARNQQLPERMSLKLIKEVIKGVDKQPLLCYNTDTK